MTLRPLPLSRSLLLSLSLSLILPITAAAASAATNATPKKNVLFLIADDLNNMLGAYGDPLARTPNLDQLAARGVRFDRAYCTYPLCGPSRNSMLTGLYPNSTGIHNNSLIFRQTIPRQLSLPQAFRQQGYFAGRIGKLYHYNVPNSIGTFGHDDPASWELALNPAGVDRTEEEPRITTLTPGQFGGTLSWYASPKSDAHHTDAMLAADAEWVLERLAKPGQRPFFLAVGFYRPHTPYVAPKDPYYGYYPREKMRIVPDIKADQADIPPAGLASYKREQDNMTDDQRRDALQGYYASITFMDAQVGRVVDALDRLGLAESTIIVFTSDHGYHTGEHGLWQKQSLFEESARVPLLIVAPGVSKPKTVAASPVSQLDLFPTLAELAGVKAPANLQGQSLAPMLRDPSFTGRGWALTQMMRGPAAAAPAAAGKGKGKAKAAAPAATANVAPAPGRFSGYSLRTPRWRYTEWNEGKAGRELYDHDTDPRELTNLAEIPAHAATVATLSAQVQAAVKTTFPPSGQTPSFLEGTWAPNLLAP